MGREDPGQQLAVRGFARDERGNAGLAALERRLAVIEAQSAAAVLVIRPVAVEAVLGEKWLHLAGEVDLRRGGRRGGRQPEGQGQPGQR